MTKADDQHDLRRAVDRALDLHRSGDFAGAAAAYEQALELMLGDLASVLARAGRREEAERYLRQIIARSPDDSVAHFNLALLLLTRGEFAEGWREYEHRWGHGGSRPPSSRSKPTWEGSPLDGKTILLMSEQGFGDTIQFVRYAPLLKSQKGAGRVVVMCEKPLVELMRTAAGVDEVAEKVQGARPPHFDTLVSAGSLPLHFQTTLETIPHEVPYLGVDVNRAARWREELKLTREVKNVGLVWAGRPEHADDRNRSFRLSELAPLAEVPAVRFVSLQMGPQLEELKSPPPGMNITDAAGGIDDFADTAALLSALDLLITVDTAPAHLAGALGRPVWTLLPFVSDFRWLLERTDSPWYPTMRLFRQRRARDWASVIDEVTRGLRGAV